MTQLNKNMAQDSSHAANPPPNPLPRGGGGGGKIALAVRSVVLVVAATAIVVMLGYLGEKFATRFDVTATGEYELSPRTQQLLGTLRGTYEVVVAADPATSDATARVRVRDVLRTFESARGIGGPSGGGARVAATFIDTGSPAGLQQLGELTRRLAERDRPAIAEQTRAVAAAAKALEDAAGFLEALSPRFQAVRDAIPAESAGAEQNKQYFDQRAAEARVNARALREAVEKARAGMGTMMPNVPVPSVWAAAEALRQPAAGLEKGLRLVAEQVKKFAGSEEMPAAARDLTGPIAADMSKWRDAVAVAAEALARLRPLDVVRVAGAVQGASVALVIGPAGTGMAAIDVSALLPAGGGGNRAELARSAEDLIATALASVARPDKPIVVLVHGENTRFLDRLDRLLFSDVFGRLAARGVDVAEWATAVDIDGPSMSVLDPSGKRAAVYVVLNANSAAGSGTGGAESSGSARVRTLGAVVSKLVDEGKPVLMSLLPSVLPTYGSPDPTAAALTRFGIEAQTGRPILKERFTPEGRQVDAFAVLTAETAADHPLARSVGRLPTRVEWPIALRITPTPESAVTVLYQVADGSAWSETQWLGYWRVPISQHPQVPDPPTKDARDVTDGPWAVSAAAERRTPGIGRQRLVVVGSNTWFLDQITQQRALVDGRAAAIYPGNAELFESAVLWLAGWDDLLAPSPTARAVPLIRPISAGALSAWRWSLAAGLPALVLLIGVAWRAARG